MQHEWKLKIDEDRYGRRDNPGLTKEAQERWPKQIVVYGTREQAEFVCDMLDGYEAGCDNFWIIDNAT